MTLGDASLNLWRAASGFPGRDGVTARPISTRGPADCAAPLLLATIGFNAALAAVNAQIAPVSANVVVVSQAGLVAAAALVAAVARPAGGTRWLLYLWGATLLFLILSLARERLELRYFSDFATIAVFVLVGLAAKPRSVARAILFAQVLLVAFAVWELAAPAQFGSALNVAGYYVSTRGFDTDAFWAGQDLFMSSERPTGRLLLAGLNIHRGSSLFLEPVSLGNWTIVVTIALGALLPVLRRREIMWLLVGNAVLLVACDGRLAMLINLLLLANWWLGPRLPRLVPPLYLPVLLVLLTTASSLGFLSEHGDTLAGRLRYGLDYLGSLDSATVLGLYSGGGVVAADSGWSYIISTQSLPALIVLWLMLSLAPAGASPGARRTVSAVALFVALSLPVSYSIFSIKTAATLWILYGCALAQDARRATPTDQVGLLKSQ